MAEHPTAVLCASYEDFLHWHYNHHSGWLSETVRKCREHIQVSRPRDGRGYRFNDVVETGAFGYMSDLHKKSTREEVYTRMTIKPRSGQRITAREGGRRA